MIIRLEQIIEDYGLTYSRVMPKGTYIEHKHEGLSLYNKDGFNRLKDDYNKSHEISLLVALLIYGFNHYLRVNNNGDFNVPVGKVDLSKSIYDNLQGFITDIKTKELVFSTFDFRESSLYQFVDSFYYFDPPYLVTTAPYNSTWGIEEETALLSLLDRLHTENKCFALSNVFLSNGKENQVLKTWAQNYHVHYMKRQYRNANYQKINITDTIEVLVTNYE